MGRCSQKSPSFTHQLTWHGSVSVGVGLGGGVLVRVEVLVGVGVEVETTDGTMDAVTLGVIDVASAHALELTTNPMMKS